MKARIVRLRMLPAFTCFALACKGRVSAAGTSGSDSLTPRQQDSVLALVRYDTAPPLHRGSDTATFTVTKPVVIANIAYTQVEVDADTNQGMIEVVDDFDTYLGPIGDSLEKQGVALESANVRVIRVHVDTAWYTYSFVAEDGRVGYVLAAPGHVPQLLSGVRTDFDLPGDVREYLQTGTVRAR